jgi:hypothetical protein
MEVDPFVALEMRRRRVSQDQENSARLAQTFAFYTTTGWGEFKDPEVINFDCTFIHEPYIAHGYSTNGDKLVLTRYPRAWGFVFQWKQDNRGYYVGAWVATVVETQAFDIPTTELDPGYSIDHSFTFTGIAIKDLQVELMEN